MRRRLFHVLTVLSLLLCGASAVLWVRSYWRYDDVAFRWQSASSFAGKVGFRLNLHPPEDAFPLTWMSGASDEIDPAGSLASADRVYFRFCGFALAQQDLSPSSDIVQILQVPYWFVTLLLAATPAARMASVLRRYRRTATGRCPTCGYDLRATADRCPECGTTL